MTNHNQWLFRQQLSVVTLTKILLDPFVAVLVLIGCTAYFHETFNGPYPILALIVFTRMQLGPRQVARALPDGGSTIAQPWPGSYYGLPLTISIVALLVGTAAVLRLIALRPAVVGVTPDWDMRLRRRSAAHLFRGIQLVLALTLAGVLALAGQALRQLGDQWVIGDLRTVVSTAHSTAGAALLITALAVLVCGAAAAFLPAQRRRATALEPAVAAS